MRFYQEITLIETPEISPYFIWSKLYNQVHLALVEQQNPDKTVSIGVSFPNYRYFENENRELSTLGDKLRVFASSKEDLEKLNLNAWLARLADYVHIRSIQEIPVVSEYLLVKRYQANTNLERLTRRFMLRESKRLGKSIGIDEAKTIQNERFMRINNVDLLEAERHYLNPTVKDFPFIRIRSSSSSEEFSLQINQFAVAKTQAGTFNTYGLSSKATVPHW